MLLPNRETRWVSDTITLRAADFEAFKNRYDSQPPEIVLILSNAGLRRLHQIRTKQADSTFVVMLHGKGLAEVTSEQWDDTQVTLLLRGMSTADGNEVLARLTE